MSNADFHASYLKRAEERRARLLAVPAVEDNNGPVYWEDRDRYYHDSGILLDEAYDDEISDLSQSLIFQCTTELAHTPDLAEIVDEAWGDEIEDWYGISDALSAKIEAFRKEIAVEAPTIWLPNYKARLELTPYPLKEERE